MLDPNEQAKLAYEFAKDVTEHLITLSTGFIAFSVTFTKDLLQRIPRRSGWLLGLCWSFYLFSVLFGLGHMLALTGELAPTPRSAPISATDTTQSLPASATLEKATTTSVIVRSSPQTIGTLPRVFSALQLLFFGLGTISIFVYGIVGLRHWRKSHREGKEESTGS